MSAALPFFYPALVAKIQRRLVPSSDSAQDCIVWPLGGKKHARLKFDGRLYSPHRVILEWKLDRVLPRSIDACHSCDNPPCCLPEHLFEGTRSANVRDAVAKGRMHPPVQTPERLAKRRATLRAKALPWDAVPLRLCESPSSHRCDLCERPITAGHLYYDRGHQIRAHLRCVEPLPAIEFAARVDATRSAAKGAP